MFHEIMIDLREYIDLGDVDSSGVDCILVLSKAKFIRKYNFIPQNEAIVQI